ncbi:MAG: Crp/Fnr family transcriptional regulator [Agriterribacter sp.]
MIEPLIEHIKTFIPVSEALTNRLQDISDTITIGKGKLLHKPNRVCENLYFIVSGLLRIYYKKDTKEITSSFSAEGEWITSIYGFMKNVPDNYYIQTLEPSELIVINIQHLEKCFLDFPEMERFGRLLVFNHFIQQNERIVSLQFHSAKERYAYFCKTAANKLYRVPLGMLASHLGITQETLSRIRAEKITF